MADTKLTAAERVAESLRQRILDGDFPAGAPLREQDLARHYGVSRHAVREVLRRLASEGVAEYSSFRGARIPLLSPEEVSDIYRARQLIECGSLVSGGAKLQVQHLAAVHGSFALAVAKEDWNSAFDIDVEFHSYIVSAAGSERLATSHRSLLLSLKLAHLSVPGFQSCGLQRSVPQHADVVLALAAHDTSAAATALKRHLADSERVLLEGLAGCAGPHEPKSRRDCLEAREH